MKEGHPHAKSSHGVLTISAGLAGNLSTSIGRDASWKDVVALADKLLYEAKHQGRNQVIWEGSSVGLCGLKASH